MQNLNFITTAKHNKRLFKSIRNFLVIAIVSALAMIIADQFYEHFTQEYVVVKSGYHVKRGWPAEVFWTAAFICFASTLFYLYMRYKQDLKKPSLGVTNEGLYINQQILRNAFVPWDNIESVELKGHVSSPVLRVFFKDYDALVKGQPAFLKSVAKKMLLPKPSIGFTKDETAGDLIKFYDFIEQQGVTASDNMAGRNKPTSGLLD